MHAGRCGTCRCKQRSGTAARPTLARCTAKGGRARGKGKGRGGDGVARDPTLLLRLAKLSNLRKQRGSVLSFSLSSPLLPPNPIHADEPDSALTGWNRETCDVPLSRRAKVLALMSARAALRAGRGG